MVVVVVVVVLVVVVVIVVVVVVVVMVVVVSGKSSKLSGPRSAPGKQAPIGDSAGKLLYQIYRFR